MNLLQTRRRTVDQAKMAKNRIRTDGFFDQYSALTGNLEKIFFALGAKKSCNRFQMQATSASMPSHGRRAPWAPGFDKTRRDLIEISLLRAEVGVRFERPPPARSRAG
jgi:hypothetical protein